MKIYSYVQDNDVDLSQVTRRCKACSQLFNPQTKRQQNCKRTHYCICPICGKEYIVDLSNGIKYVKKACSKECIEKLRIQHIKSTNLQRYGVECSLQNSKVQAKACKTAKEKYNVDKPSDIRKVPKIQQKIEETNLQRYDVKCALQNTKIKAAYEQKNLEKYGFKNPAKSPEIIQKIKNTQLQRYGQCYSATDKSKKYESELRYKNANQLEIIPKGYGVSNFNKAFAELCNKHNIQTEFEYPLDGKNFDLHIIGQQILIEIDPTYTHNTDKCKGSKSQLARTLIAEQSGFRCIHIFDWDNWNDIIALIQPKQPIGARKCEIHNVSKDVVKEFENNYHLQGYCNNQAICLGLYYNNELIQLMTFGKPRYNKKYEYELLRLCTKSQYSVIGGAEKLFKFFITHYAPQSIISYCDRAKFTGKVYERLGMKLDHISEPQKIWSKCKYKITSNLLRQRGYDQLFHTNYGKGVNNEDLMRQNKWLAIYDCGQLVYTWINKT